MQSRQSRMDKYYDSNIDIDDSSVMPSRTKKNQELYKEVGTLDLEDFDLNNNVSIIGESTESISLDEIQDILSEKYRDNGRNKSIGDTEEIALPKINLDETREYDLNSILEKVKENKEIDYEEERLRKVRSSQYDILKDLDKLNNDEDIEEEDLYEDDVVLPSNEIVEEKVEVKVVAENEKQEKELLELIDTIVAKELISDDTDEIPIEIDDEPVGELDPLDILSDLRGDDDTKVMGAIQIDEETEKTLGLFTEEIVLDEDEEYEDTASLECIEEDEVESKIKEATEEVKVTQVTEDTLSNSFATESIKITDEDFDDFADLKEKGGLGKVVMILIILALIVAFVFGVILLFNKL